MSLPNWLQKRAPFIFFMSFYFVLCACLYRDFGISWDEYDCYSIGSALFHYLVGNGWKASDFLEKVGGWDKGWNPNFWIPYDYWYTAFLYAFNRGFSMELFHWMNMVFAGLMFWGAYEVLLDVTENPWGALLGPLALLWTPRLMGYVPINPRDATFAVLFFIALVGIYFWGDPSRFHSYRVPLRYVLWMGLLIGMAQSTRLVGLALYPLWLIYGAICISMENGMDRRERLGHFKTLVCYVLMSLVVAHILMVLTWPYLGANFFRHYLELLRVSTRFPFAGSVIFMGRNIQADALPWYFLPVWLWVSTPLVVLIPAVASPFVLYFAKGRRLWILLSGAILGILLLWAVMRPVIYGDYRHFLFVVPPISVLGGWSIYVIFQKIRDSRLFWFAILLFVAGAVVSMTNIVRLHPYEYIYLNEFVGGIGGSQGRYPTEMSGSGFKECALWLKQNLPPVPGRVWKVNTLAQPFQSFYYFPKYIRWSEFDEADLFVAFSNCNGFYDTQNKFHSLSGWVPIYSVKRCGVPLFYIFKRNGGGSL